MCVAVTSPRRCYSPDHSWQNHVDIQKYTLEAQCNRSRHASSEHALAMQVHGNTGAHLKQKKKSRDVNGSNSNVDVDLNLILPHLLRCNGGNM